MAVQPKGKGLTIWGRGALPYTKALCELLDILPSSLKEEGELCYYVNLIKFGNSFSNLLINYYNYILQGRFVNVLAVNSEYLVDKVKETGITGFIELLRKACSGMVKFM